MREPFSAILTLIFITQVPDSKKEATLRRLMLVHRARPDFWVGKSGALGPTRRQRRNAPPQWTPANRTRAVILWIEETFGLFAIAELRAAYRAGAELAPILARLREKFTLEDPPKRPAHRPRGSRNRPKPATVITLREELDPKPLTSEERPRAWEHPRKKAA